MMAIILSTSGNKRLVQLAAEYHSGHENSAELVTADFSGIGADIVRMTTTSAPVWFRLSSTELDELAQAWLDYRTEYKLSHDVEQQRQARAVADARLTAKRRTW